MEDRRAYHIASVKGMRDGSVLIVPPKKVRINRMTEINTHGRWPQWQNAQSVTLPSLHATYHPRTGFKHLTLDDAGLLATFNTKALRSQKVFEPLLRIFPSNPSKFPYVAETRAVDSMFDIDSIGKRPIGFIFHVTNHKKDEIDVKGNVAFRVVPVLGLNVVITAFVATKEDRFLERWPDQTVWTTPY